MKYIQFSFGIILTSLILSCKADSGPSSDNESDTTKAVEFAVRTALQSNREDFDSLRAKYKAGDTIIVTTDSLPLADLPVKVDTIPLKVLDHTALCSSDTTPGAAKEYLYIRAFEKNDTGFYVSVASQNCQRASNGEALGVYITKKKTKGGSRF